MIGDRVRVELEDGRWLGVLRQAAAHAIDARAQSSMASFRSVPQREVQPHVASTFLRRGIDLLEPGDRADRLLERPCEQFLDLERADARVVDADGNRRLLEVGQQIDRQAGQRDPPRRTMIELIIDIMMGVESRVAGCS